jgi:hypothetical protein
MFSMLYKNLKKKNSKEEEIISFIIPAWQTFIEITKRFCNQRSLLGTQQDPDI